MAAKTLGLGLLLVLAAGGGYYLLRNDTGKPVEPGATGGTPEAGTPPKVEPRQAEVKFLADVKAVPREDRVALPDGTWARALNGAKNPPPMDWPRDVPWSPIVDMRVDKAGQEWYWHADGSRSTTGMTWRSELGREDAYTQVANPTKAMPRDDAPGPRLPPDPIKRQ